MVAFWAKVWPLRPRWYCRRRRLGSRYIDQQLNPWTIDIQESLAVVTSVGVPNRHFRISGLKPKQRLQRDSPNGRGGLPSMSVGAHIRVNSVTLLALYSPVIKPWTQASPMR